MSAVAHGAPSRSTPALPLAVQVGFAGSRRLFADIRRSSEDEAVFRLKLRAALKELPATLGLTEQHFVVGISQLAAGADTLFTESLAELGWSQRIFLPQLRSDFLAASGTDGPDFQPDEAARAARLFESPHIIEETIASTAPDRTARFEDTNLRILAEADMLVCLRREGAPSRPGGTGQLMQRAQARGIPVLELLVRPVADGGIPIVPRWQRLDQFKPPTLPQALQTGVSRLSLPEASLPASVTYAECLKHAGSRHAGQRRERFHSAARVIIGTHVVATLLAVLAIKAPDSWHSVVLALLLLELALLAWGLTSHWRLHHTKATWEWAVARLCAEIGRSVRALDGLPVSLAYLQAMPLPQELVPVLRTINLLHLRDSRVTRAADWERLRDRYLQVRLLAEESGQLPYYDRQKDQAARFLSIATWCFTVLSFLAFTATLIKAAVIAGIDAGAHASALTTVAGVLAAWLPVVAVGAMTMATARDTQARTHTFDEMHRFLEAQAKRVHVASSLRELAALAAETETRLLGETLTWFARRAYTSVS